MLGEESPYYLLSPREFSIVPRYPSGVLTIRRIGRLVIYYPHAIDYLQITVLALKPYCLGFIAYGLYTVRTNGTSLHHTTYTPATRVFKTHTATRCTRTRTHVAGSNRYYFTSSHRALCPVSWRTDTIALSGLRVPAV